MMGKTGQVLALLELTFSGDPREAFSEHISPLSFLLFFIALVTVYSTRWGKSR